MSGQEDPRLSWAIEAPGREVVQSIKPSPDGWSVETEWRENGVVMRKDCEIAIRRGVSSSASAAGFIKRLFGG